MFVDFIKPCLTKFYSCIQLETPWYNCRIYGEDGATTIRLVKNGLQKLDY